MSEKLRIGQGVDVHAYCSDRPLILAGITVSDHDGLTGHSDADVLIHAVMDALLGATGGGDIGELFPDTDDRYLNANSRNLLIGLWQKLYAEGWRMLNLDCTVLAEKPRLSPFKKLMQHSLAEVFGIEDGDCGIKATTTEKMGFVGRQEGMMAMAVVLLRRES